MPTALVTGASRGIGAAVAKRLAADGHDIAIHYHQHQAGAEATLQAVQDLGRDASIHQADLGDPSAVADLAEGVRRRWPDLTLLVNNAGIYQRGAAQGLRPEAWRRTLAVDLEGPALLAQALAPHLPSDRGTIVHISSVVAMRGSSHGAHYAAAKAGLLGLTKAQAREWAPLRVNAVCPGYIDTDILAGDSQERRAARAAEVPLGRVGAPDDVAAAVSFLCSKDAAYITGHALQVNGGLWMG